MAVVILFIDNTILYLKNPKTLQKALLELLSKFEQGSKIQNQY